MRGILFDQGHVVADAPALLREAGVSERCTVASGDFREEVPRGGDLYLLKAILHNWDDTAALTILKSCRRAMTGEARLCIVDWLIPEGKTTRGGFLDLHMLVIHGGHERDLAEVASLLALAGFQLGNVVHTLAGLSVVEGKPC
jgi:hypothetical protein